MAAQQAAVVQSEGEGDHHTEKFVCGAANVCIVLVPWEPEDPGPHQVYLAMEPGEPYTAGELSEQFDVTRHTIHNRLETLVDMGEVRRKKHAPNRVTYWVPV